jgi:tripartite-type tricarboxylate transporter receptor subunit TctC
MMFESRFRPLLALVACVPLLAFAPKAGAQAFPDPNRNIELIVPYAPGGSTDAMARMIAPRLQEILKSPVVVMNRAGAAGAIGTAYGLATSDGYRIIAAGNSNLGPGLIARDKPSYTLDDVSSLARATINPLLFVAKKGRFASFEAFVKEAREKPDTITFGTWGPRSPAHFYGEMIGDSIGGKLRHIPYDSGSKAMLAALAGQIDIAVATAATAKASINSGQLMGLFVSTDYKLADFPNVESIKTLGYPNAVYVSFEGFVTGAKVPADRVAVLRSAFEKILNDPKVKASLAEGGAEPSYQSGPQYDQHLRSNLTTLSEIRAKVGMED